MTATVSSVGATGSGVGGGTTLAEVEAREQRLRALSTGEPSPDIAALLDELGESIIAHFTRGMSSARQAAERIEAIGKSRHARAAVDAHLVSLLARLTAAERTIKAVQQVVDDWENWVPLDGAVRALRAALPPSGDTRGET